MAHDTLRQTGDLTWPPDGGPELMRVTQVANTARTDVQLECLLYETGDWAVSDADGLFFCAFSNLYDALVMAWDRIVANEPIFAVHRISSEPIILADEQLQRLAKAVGEHNQPGYPV
jgi:hypothetical protein